MHYANDEFQWISVQTGVGGGNSNYDVDIATSFILVTQRSLVYISQIAELKSIIKAY
jgi:hypothetical protein